MEDEIEVISHLIEATGQRLTDEKLLKDLMVEFKGQRERFLKGEQSKAHTALMVKTARNILDMITQQHLNHLFSTDYLEELTVFSSVATKRSLAKP
jgi:hypothetical protein